MCLAALDCYVIASLYCAYLTWGLGSHRASPCSKHVAHWHAWHQRTSQCHHIAAGSDCLWFVRHSLQPRFHMTHMLLIIIADSAGMSCICSCHASSQKWLRGAVDLLVCMQTAVSMQAIKDVQSGTRILYVICAEGKANKNITIANLVSLQTCTLLVAVGSCSTQITPSAAASSPLHQHVSLLHVVYSPSELTRYACIPYSATWHNAQRLPFHGIR